MYVNNESTVINDYLSSGELLVAKELVDTYIAILNTPDTLKKVIVKADLDYSVDELLNMISAGAVNETEIFYVTVTSTDPYEAAEIADTIGIVLPERISKIVEKSSVSVVQYAEVSKGKVSPNVFNYTVCGALIGLALSVVIIVLSEFMDNSIQDENYLTDTYGVRILALIPDMGKKTKSKKRAKHRKIKNNKKAVYYNERNFLCEHLPFAVSEAYKTLRANLQNLYDTETGSKVIGVTSPNPNDGKSTLAINLAYALAQAGKKCC